MSFLRSLSVVLSAFLGIRKQRDAARDTDLAPWQIIISILLLLACFIAGLLLLAIWITRIGSAS